MRTGSVMGNKTRMVTGAAVILALASAAAEAAPKPPPQPSYHLTELLPAAGGTTTSPSDLSETQLAVGTSDAGKSYPNSLNPARICASSVHAAVFNVSGAPLTAPAQLVATDDNYPSTVAGGSPDGLLLTGRRYRENSEPDNCNY